MQDNEYLYKKGTTLMQINPFVHCINIEYKNIRCDFCLCK